MAFNKKYKFNKRDNSPVSNATFIPGDESTAIKGQIKWKGSVPEKETIIEHSETIQNYAFKDLQTKGIIDVAAGPNETVLQADQPYPVIARTNKVLDSGYSGVENIKGNALVRIFNSDKTQLLNNFDLGTINMRFNYLYAAYKLTDQNIAVNVELNKVMDEALSRGYSTMLTQLPFYTDKVYSDMPDPDTFGAGKTPAILGEGTAVKHKSALLLHYQSVLQTLVSPLAKYILTMSLEKCAMNMSYRREAPIVTSLFGLLKKKAFISTLNALGTTIIADYFDQDWYKQMNTMSNLSSRKSNSMTDPLLTMSATHIIPKTKIYAASGSGYASEPYYNSDDLKISGIFINPDTFEVEGSLQEPTTIYLEDAVYRLNRMLDVSTILTWARQLNEGTLGKNVTMTTPSAYYEKINKLISAIQIMAAKFTSAMTEVRTFLDKMTDSGMIYWKKGMWINVEHVEQVDPQYNLILSHVFKIAMSGAPDISWDSQTQRWRVNTLWNKYEGIAAFDNMSGGAFLTCSLRKMPDVDGYTKTDSLYLIPKLFTTELKSGYESILFTTRGGVRLRVVVQDQNTALSDPSLARLDPLSEGFKVRRPVLVIPTSVASDNVNKIASAALSLLTNVAGYGAVYYNTTAQANFKCSAVDPDYIAFVDKELEDVSNQMITFCRNFAPFRVSTPDGARQIGFGRGMTRS